MKNITFAFILLITGFSFGQKSIKLPELDTKNKVHTLQFSPDVQDKNIISAYLKSKTEKDSLRFWAEGTILKQNVMVTILSPNKKAKIKVDIVKNHWEDSKIDAHLKNGVFQESFDTSGKFGIVVTSSEPNIPFYLAVWTSGEIIPDMSRLYYNASDGPNNITQQKSLANNSNSKGSLKQTEVKPGTNYLMIAIIVILVIIALLLGIMVLKKKKGTTVIILLFLFLSPEMLNAQGQSLSSIVFRDIIEDYQSAQNLIRYSRQLRDSGVGRRPLDPYDEADSEANVNPAGGPRLPSSCIPTRYGGTQEDGASETNSGGESNSDTRSNDTTEEPENETDTPSMSDEDAQKYAEEKNLLREARNDLNLKARELLEENLYENQKIYRELVDSAQSVYNAQMLAASNSAETQTTLTNAFNAQMATLSTAHVNRIQGYQRQNEQQQRLNDADYDRRLKQLNERFSNSDDEDSENEDEGDVSENSNSDEQESQESTQDESSTGSNTSNEGQDSSNDEGCSCLDRAYIELDKRRLNLERLRIIYAHAMKKINAGMAFGDNVSGVHGVSGLVWQKQKLIILKESIPTLQKAYDEKYAEMIEALEENLLEIDRCEALLGYENWYNHAGFIYFQFMADKYKRN